MKLAGKSMTEKAREKSQKIISDNYGLMDQLTSEQELSSNLGVSRNTIREALKSLENEGILLSRHGVGTFVIRDPKTMKHNLAILDSTTDIIQSHGYTAGTKSSEYKTARVWDDVAKSLNAADGSSVLYIGRVRTADDRPLVFVEDFIPDNGEILEAYDKQVNKSLFAILNNLGKTATFANCSISAVISDARTNEKLELLKPTPLLLLKQTHYTAKGVPVVYSESYFLSEKFEFSILRRQSKN